MTGIMLVTIAALGLYFVPGLRQLWSASDRKEANARKKLAFESLRDRLPKGKPLTPLKPLDAESNKRWENFDSDLAHFQDYRAELLKALHEKTRKFFVESPGEGSFRGIRILPAEDDILLDTGSGDVAPRQPGEPAVFPISPGETLNPIKPDKELHSHHDAGLFQFFFPFGLGYIKDRDQVAGFTAHGFRYPPVPNLERSRWRVKHVQLVGILSQEQPVVYLTDRLPSMEQVRQGKTRSLDLFEDAGLSSLREGQDLYVIQKEDTIRMLAHLRATKTCQQCHDAQIGDLLGALSYVLRPPPSGWDEEIWQASIPLAAARWRLRTEKP